MYSSLQRVERVRSAGRGAGRSRRAHRWREQPTRGETMMDTPESEPRVLGEVARVKLFIGIQVFFLALSPFTGGFNYKLWSMLDSALLIQSIGVTALVLVLEEEKHRRLAFKTSVIIYLLALLDMGINVLISGVVGWQT